MKSDQAQKLAGLVIDYLKGRGELGSLPELIKTLKQKSLSLGLENMAVVTSPTQLGPAELKAITGFIQEKYGRDLTLVEKLDPGLIAGFTIQVGDEVIDTSLSAKLENIRKELV